MNDYRQIARAALHELRRSIRRGDLLGERQAVEKAYLAAVTAARAMVACSGGVLRETPRSSAAIGRVGQLVKERNLGEDGREVIKAMGRALAQHRVCFYDNICDREDVREAVQRMAKAAKKIPRLCERLARP